MKIESFSGGQIPWSNTVPDAVYQIEWRAALTRGDWSNRMDSLDYIAGTGEVFCVNVPQFYRVTATSYIEETNSDACYQMYSNALLDAAVALPEEISTDLLPLLPGSPGTEWRTFTN